MQLFMLKTQSIASCQVFGSNIFILKTCYSSLFIIILIIEKMKVKLTDDFVINYGVPLGSGAFGDVFQGTWISKDTFVAIKRIKDHISRAKQMMVEEVKVMENIKHPNILSILEVVYSQMGTFLIIDYCQGGSLEKQIKQSKTGIPQINCFKFLKQIVDGMVKVNQSKHIHRDLKPQNILFTKDKIIKVCDFGLARRILGDDPNKIQKFSAKGTPLYACPQVLGHQKYSGKCDVWSLGLILVQMLTKVHPFHQAKNLATLINLQQKLTSNGHYVFEAKCNPWFKQIVPKMVAYNEKDRISFSDLQEQILRVQDQFMRSFTEFNSIPITKVTNLNQNGGQQTNMSFPQKTKPLNDQKFDQRFRSKQRQSEPPQNEGSITRIEQRLLTREENKKLLVGLKSYIQFLYARGKLYADIGTKYFQAKENPKQNGYKFMVLFLSISIFLKSIQKIIEIICKSQSYTLPDGRQIKFAALDPVSKKDFQSVQTNYETQMKSQSEKFNVTLNQIYSKMFSEKYKMEYKGLLQDNKQLLNQLEKMKNKLCTKNVQYFEQKYRKFFSKQGYQSNYKNLPESFIRMYWVCMTLANVNKTLNPITCFLNGYAINQVIDDTSKLSIDKIKSQIQKLHSQLQD